MGGMTDLESLAGRMGLENGTVGVVFHDERPPRLLLRVDGGQWM